MAWKPKTIAGKILKGAVIAGAGVAAIVGIAATGGAATPAVAAAGKGVFGKIIGITAKAATQVGKGVSAVARGAANLVTGVTAEQRQMIREQKAETRTGIKALTTIKRLINAGATVDEAAEKVGVPMEELKGSFGIPSEAEELTIAKNSVEPTKAGGCATVFLLLMSAGSLIASFIAAIIIFS